MHIRVILLPAGLIACTSQNSSQNSGTARTLAQLDSVVRHLEDNQVHWALWRSPRSLSGFMPSIVWYPEDAFPDKLACHAALQALIDKMRAKGSITDEESYQVEASQGGVTRNVLRCLPDTIDPRRSQ